MLYVEPGGLVRAGRLTTEDSGAGEGTPTLVSRTGEALGPQLSFTRRRHERPFPAVSTNPAPAAGRRQLREEVA